MKVPFALPDIGSEEIEAAVQSLRSGWMSTGPETKLFEEEFAAFVAANSGQGAPQALAVNSATSGLHLALEAAGVGPGDEVIVPTWTFTSSAEVVRYLGATPVIVDVDPLTLNMTIDNVRSAVTSRTKVIMPVHFAGLSVDMPPIRALAQEHNLKIIEDAAHAFPCLDNGQLVGASDSFATVFSFYATKTITTGEGGMVLSRHPEAVDRMKIMRLHGIDRDAFARYNSDKPAWQYQIVAPGFKYNMTDVAAAIGRVQLHRARNFHQRRNYIASQYRSCLRDLPLNLPVEGLKADAHSWHLFVVRLRDEAPLSREEFIEQMATLGVSCSVHFIPLHLQPYWRDSYALQPEQFPAATSEFERAVSLPIYTAMSDEQVRSVIEATRMLLS